MFVFLSPTKTMKKPDLTGDYGNFTTPFFLQKAEELNSSLKKQNRADLGKLMKLSDKLAEQTWCNIQKWGTDELEKTPSVLTYQGTAFKNLNPQKWSNDIAKYAQENLIIFSGLYGVLRPYDLVENYRLEMGLKAGFLKEAMTLYVYWEPSLMKYLKPILENKMVINLASNEYFKTIQTISKVAKVINCAFFDKSGKEYKIIANYSKAARGSMASFIMAHKIKTINQLKKYNDLNYTFNAEMSDSQNLVFTRNR